MIFMTDEKNDRDLIKHFGGLAVPIPIPHGDFNFFGYWVGGEGISVAGERKKIRDIVNCITVTGRYLAQWQALKAAGFDRIFLIVEGYTHCGDNGLLEIKKGKDWVPYEPFIEYHRFEMYLDEVANYLGVQVKRTHNARETALAVTSLYMMYSKPPEKHNSLKQFYVVPPDMAWLYGKPSLIRRVAKELEGIGWDKSVDVEKRFKNVYAMVNAKEVEWQQVKGIGKKLAGKIVGEIHTNANTVTNT